MKRFQKTRKTREHQYQPVAKESTNRARNQNGAVDTVVKIGPNNDRPNLTHIWPWSRRVIVTRDEFIAICTYFYQYIGVILLLLTK